MILVPPFVYLLIRGQSMINFECLVDPPWQKSCFSVGSRLSSAGPMRLTDLPRSGVLGDDFGTG